MGVPVRTSALEAKRWVATGETLSLTGRLIASAETMAKARIEATDANGGLVAALERDYNLSHRATFLKRMGYDAVPAGFEDVLPE